MLQKLELGLMSHSGLKTDFTLPIQQDINGIIKELEAVFMFGVIAWKNMISMAKSLDINSCIPWAYFR